MAAFGGYVDLEDTLVVPVLTVNASDVPTPADSTPTFIIYSPSAGTAIDSGTCTTPGSISSVTGAYVVSQAINAASGYAAGTTYFCLVSYLISTAQRRQEFEFTVT